MNFLDKAISYLAPAYGLQRVTNRAKIVTMDTHVRRYEGAATGRRHNGWFTSKASVNQEINTDGENLRTRSRNLYQNNSYDKRSIRVIGNNVVGTGIIPAPVSVKENDIKVLKEAWLQWGEKTTCDYDGNFNFYGLQKLVMKTVALSGECLIIRKRVKSEVSKVGVQLLVLEGDYIDTSESKESTSGGAYVQYGISYNADNKRDGYYIFDKYPTESGAKSHFIKIEDIIHVYEIDRPGQNRGVPFSSSSLLKQRDLDDYEDAELLGKKTSACFPVFIQNNALEGDVKQDPVETLEPGMVSYLNNGETVQFASPPQNPGFAEYIKTQQRAVAAGKGVTYEQMTGDYSNVNFSSGRMGWIEFQKNVDDWQWLMLIPKFCEVAYGWFIEGVKIGAGLSKDAQVAVTWTAPKREMIDPTKEIAAMRSLVRAGLTSWQEIIRQTGYQPEDVIRELKEDQKRFEDAGLKFEWSPSLYPPIVPGQTPAAPKD